MLHGHYYKNHSIGDNDWLSPFTVHFTFAQIPLKSYIQHPLTSTNCAARQWPYRNESHVTCAILHAILERNTRFYADSYPQIARPERFSAWQ